MLTHLIRYLPASRSSSQLVNSISTGNWNLRRFGMERQGVTQVLPTYAHVCSRMMCASALSSLYRSARMLTYAGVC